MSALSRHVPVEFLVTKVDIEKYTQRFLTEGIKGIESHLINFPAGNQRIKLLESIRKAVAATYIENHQLDRMQEIYEACIAEALSLAEGDEKALLYANVTSYNLAANLADCWSDAEEPRSSKHFNAGLIAANRCLELRNRLQKPPAAMAMACFILGVHEYSLENYSNAEKAWSKKLEYEFQTIDTESDAERNLNVLLSQGLIGLARWSKGTEDGSAYEASIRHLNGVRNAENDKEIDLFVTELKLLKEKHGHSLNTNSH